MKIKKVLNIRLIHFRRLLVERRGKLIRQRFEFHSKFNFTNLVDSCFAIQLCILGLH